MRLGYAHGLAKHRGESLDLRLVRLITEQQAAAHHPHHVGADRLGMLEVGDHFRVRVLVSSALESVWMTPRPDTIEAILVEHRFYLKQVAFFALRDEAGLERDTIHSERMRSDQEILRVSSSWEAGSAAGRPLQRSGGSSSCRSRSSSPPRAWMLGLYYDGDRQRSVDLLCVWCNPVASESGLHCRMETVLQQELAPAAARPFARDLADFDSVAQLYQSAIFRYILA